MTLNTLESEISPIVALPRPAAPLPIEGIKFSAIEREGKQFLALEIDDYLQLSLYNDKVLLAIQECSATLDAYEDQVEQ